MKGKLKLKYIPCADSSFRATRYICRKDNICYAQFRADAKFKEIYDARDGTQCSLTKIACPC